MITLVTGGVKSGKSRRALELCGQWTRPVTFLATAEVLDDEMRMRIKRHKAERSGLGFITVEEPLDMKDALGRSGDYVLVDCLTMWVNNLMYRQLEADFSLRLGAFIDGLLGKSGAIVVSNETGLGNIPSNELTRRYNLLLAEANRRMAAAASRVEFMVAGIPLIVK